MWKKYFSLFINWHQLWTIFQKEIIKISYENFTPIFLFYPLTKLPTVINGQEVISSWIDKANLFNSIVDLNSSLGKSTLPNSQDNLSTISVTFSPKAENSHDVSKYLKLRKPLFRWARFPADILTTVAHRII